MSGDFYSYKMRHFQKSSKVGHTAKMNETLPEQFRFLSPNLPAIPIGTLICKQQGKIIPLLHRHTFHKVKRWTVLYSVRYIYCIHSGQMSNKYTHSYTSNDVIFVNYFYPHSLPIYPLEGLDPLPTMYYYQ